MVASGTYSLLWSLLGEGQREQRKSAPSSHTKNLHESFSCFSVKLHFSLCVLVFDKSTEEGMTERDAHADGGWGLWTAEGDMYLHTDPYLAPG